MGESQDYSAPFDERHKINAAPPPTMSSAADDDELELQRQLQQQQRPEYMVKIVSSNETSMGSSLSRSQTINLIGYYERFKQKSWWEMGLLLYLMFGLFVYTIGLCITANTFWAVFGPVSMFCFLFVASLHRDYQEGSLRCSFLSDFRYMIFGD